MPMPIASRTGGEPGGEREPARSPAVHDRAGPGRAGDPVRWLTRSGRRAAGSRWHAVGCRGCPGPTGGEPVDGPQDVSEHEQCQHQGKRRVAGGSAPAHAGHGHRRAVAWSAGSLRAGACRPWRRIDGVRRRVGAPRAARPGRSRRGWRWPGDHVPPRPEHGPPDGAGGGLNPGSSIPAIATPIRTCSPSVSSSVSLPRKRDSGQAARAVDGDHDHERREAAGEPGRPAHVASPAPGAPEPARRCGGRPAGAALAAGASTSACAARRSTAPHDSKRLILATEVAAR